MFHQAHDISAFLSPISLEEYYLAESQTQTFVTSPSELLNLVQADFARRVESDPLISRFLEENGFDIVASKDLENLEARFASAIVSGKIRSDTVYELGVVSFKNNEITDAVYAFTIVASHAELRAAALSGLAACACFQSAFEEAFLLAKQGIESNETHPRTYLIAGYSGLKLGYRKSAKHLLALVTRLARGDPRYRNEQRCAQRELLLMQLAD